MIIDLAKLSQDQAYFALTQTVLPRPIAWVLTENESGNYNLAPFSFFNAVCSAPPILMMSIGKKPNGEQKDTLVNIQRSGRFVVHIPSNQHMEAVNNSAATLGYGDSEVNACELSLLPFNASSDDDKVLPRVEGLGVAFSCRLYRLDRVGINDQAIVYGQASQMYLADDVASYHPKNGRLTVNSEELAPLARLGGAEYGTLGQRMSLKRPK